MIALEIVARFLAGLAILYSLIPAAIMVDSAFRVHHILPKNPYKGGLAQTLGLWALAGILFLV